MRLIVFDIDGTLTDTMEADTAAFIRSFEEVFGFKEINADWSCYKNATDSGIFREVFESRAGRGPSADETTKFIGYFVDLLRSGAERSAYAAMPGARELLARLRQNSAYAVALATGCWSDSARVKMTSAGMNYDGYPAASADDAAEREAIIKFAMERATRDTDHQITDVAYVGDGVWDARACQNLGIPFVAIAANEYRDKLIAAGAVAVLPNFSDGERFRNLVDRVARSVGSQSREAVLIS